MVPAVYQFAESGDNLFVATEGGVYLSTNSGASWTKIVVVPDSLTPINHITSASGVLVASDDTGDEYLSSDNGANWAPIWIGDLIDVYSLYSYGSTVFAGANRGVYSYRVPDGNWRLVNDGLGDVVLGFAVSDSFLYAGTYSRGVWRRPLSEITAVNGTRNEQPGKFSLAQNYPNPFNPSTTIGYRLPTNSFVSLKVFDILGREIRTLANQRQTAGEHLVTFDASRLPSGVYLYRLQAGSFTETRKLTVLK